MGNSKYFVMSTTEGCATNLLENSQYKNAIEESGEQQAGSIDEADVIVVNTCGYSQHMEDRAIKEISTLKEKYPNKKIVIGGCLPSINKSAISSFSDGDTFRPGHVNKMLELAGIEYSVKKDFENVTAFDPQDFSSLSFKHRILNSVRGVYFKIEKLFGGKFQPLSNIVSSAIVNDEYHMITVSTGCLGECAFCSIKMAKGSVKSRETKSIIQEFKKSLESGKRKFWLLGDDIGCYGQDIGTNIVSLLEEMFSVEEKFELVVNYVEPMFLEQYYDRFIKIIADKRLVNINFPIQSGSKKIVYNMRRFYNPENIHRMMKEVRLVNSCIVRKTNLIVGYPGETFGDFIESIKSVKYFDALVAFRFTPRNHTIAAKLPNQISNGVIEIRFLIMNIAIFLRHVIVLVSSCTKIRRP